MAVELSDTELGIPGAGTVGRWVRESPEGFAFTVRAPKIIAESGFAKTKENRAVLKELAGLVETLNARAAVFTAPDTFKPTRATKAALQAFCSGLPSSIPTIVLDLPAWKPSVVMDTVAKRKVITAVDPLQEEWPVHKKMAYLQLPGPAGHRSRYDAESLEAIEARCLEIAKQTSEVFCVFRNIDMHANAKSLRAALGQ